MTYERGDAQRYCGDDGDDGAEHGDWLDGVQVEDRDDDQSASSVTCRVVSPNVFHVSSFVSEVHWLHMYSQSGGMVADNFHGDVEEFCEVFGVVVPCNVCDVHARIISYFPVCRLQKFRQVFTNVHTTDGNWRKVSEKLCKVYDMVDEVFMKCVNVVERS